MPAVAEALPKLYLPSSSELPSSDDTPVDNEDQNFIPNFLLFLLENIWAERQDWYFGVDMGVYYNPYEPAPAIVPDAFLSLGVQRRKPTGRLSYTFWEEEDTIPSFVLEMVSQKYGGEYKEKAITYAKIKVPYYLVYNPNHWQRHNKEPFEIYKLINGSYEKQLSEPYFMPEIGLGIGRESKVVRGIEREVLCWYDSLGNTYKNAEEQLLDTKELLSNTETKLSSTEAKLSNTEIRLSDTENELVGTKKQLSALEKEVIEYRKLFGKLPKDSF